MAFCHYSRAVDSSSNVRNVLVSARRSTVAIAMGALFLWLLTQRKTPIGDIKLAVGDEILPFSVAGADGWFDSESLYGQRTLLKFFRGSW